MIPINYKDIHNWEGLEIWLEGSNPEGEPSVRGSFTSMRIDRDTIPEGFYAYDIREADNDSEMWFSELKDYVLVNHAGTILTENKVEGSENGVAIIDYSFY